MIEVASNGNDDLKRLHRRVMLQDASEKPECSAVCVEENLF